MRNRAKCKKCNSIIESTYRHDYVRCACGEIFVDGGDDYFRYGASDMTNFIRLDDEGNPIEQALSIKKEAPKEEPPAKKNLDELIDILDEMNRSFDRMPLHAQMSYATHCDLNAAMLLMAQIVKAIKAQLD